MATSSFRGWRGVSVLFWGGCLALLVAPGCNWFSTAKPAAPPTPPPPVVKFSNPIKEKYTEYEEFSGHIRPIESIDLRARVSGTLEEALFRDGDRVRRDQLLFKIDPRPYQADVDKATASLEQATARWHRLETQVDRAKKLLADSAISQEEVDILNSDSLEAKATASAAAASLDLANYYLNHTLVKAPIEGQISRRMVDPGNLIRADDTILANIVSVDPIYAYFDVDERTVLRSRRQATAVDPKESRIELEMSLADRDDFSLRGVVDFVENRLDANTGTLTMRAKIDNHDQLLSAGMFVRIRYPLGSEKQGLMVPEVALGSDQGRSFLYVLDADDKVVYRQVQLGPLIKGRRVIEDNLQADDRVVVEGLQRIRPGVKVTPQPFGAPERSVAQEGANPPVNKSR